MYFHGKKVGQFDLVNTKESILPDKLYHKNKEKYRNGRRLKFCGTVHWASTMRLFKWSTWGGLACQVCNDILSY